MLSKINVIIIKSIKKNNNNKSNVRKSQSLISHTREKYSGPYKKSKMEHFTKIVNDFQPLTIVARRSIFDV